LNTETNVDFTHQEISLYVLLSYNTGFW